MTPTVSASGLTLRYGGTVALDDVSLRLSEGVTGLLGPNGAGKTTLLRMLATACSPDRASFTAARARPGTPRPAAWILRARSATCRRTPASTRASPPSSSSTTWRSSRS